MPDFPKRIKADNGPEFISKDVDRWAYWNTVGLDFSRLGRPSDNGVVEAFNSRFRQEGLNQHWIRSMEDAREKVLAWQIEYNTDRPRTALACPSLVQIEPVQKGEEISAA